ncbi:MAG: DNA polymerase III subunit delta [Acidobacteria bacterium]|nr:DNA polymerase III subunit delta [Acidobacteriota bacterium]
MPVAAASVVREQMAAGGLAAVYLLTGEDDVEKSALAGEIAALIDEPLRAFNVERIHAGEWTSGDRLLAGVAEIAAAARTLPMLSSRRIVIVAQAETLLAPKRESAAAERAHADFANLLRHPAPETTLVLLATKIHKGARGVHELLLKHATIVECGTLDGAAGAERWVRSRVAAQGVEIEPAAVRLIAERAGVDLPRLRGDIERLLLYTLGQPRITAADVRELVGPAALQDEWAMANAIEAGDAPRALVELARLLDSGAAPEKVLGQLGWLVRTKFPAIAPGALPRAVDAVFRTDQALKGSAGDPRVLLDRLVIELCADRRARGAAPRRR